MDYSVFTNLDIHHFEKQKLGESGQLCNMENHRLCSPHRLWVRAKKVTMVGFEPSPPQIPQIYTKCSNH